MEINSESKGQIFVVAAVIFSSLILLVVLSYQQVIVTESGPNYRYFFQNSLNQQPVAMDRQLRDNYSVEGIREEIYSFNSFVDTRSAERQVTYSGFQFMILPEKQTALIVNYRDQSTDYSFYYGSWDNSSVPAMQYSTVSIPEGRQSFRLNVSELDIEERLSVANPTMIGFIQMEAESETWRNYIVR